MTQMNLSRQGTGLLVIDVQEKIFSQVEMNCQLLKKLQQIIRGFQIFGLPIYVSEQYPKGLGATISPLKEALGTSQSFFSKTSFSCLGDEELKEKLLNSRVDSWVLVGVEAHVCILQTAKDLLDKRKTVVVLNDAISSRSIYDYSSAIAELRDVGSRISTTETILFELLGNSKDEKFKEISKLVQWDSDKEFTCCQL